MRHFFKEKPKLGAAVSGLMAGLVNGLFGAGGGMLLLPLLDAPVRSLKAHVALCVQRVCDPPSVAGVPRRLFPARQS